MNKSLRKRISNLTLIVLLVATGLVAAGVITLSRPLPEYLVAKSVLIPGERIGIDDFELQGLDLGEASGLYLTSQDAPNSFYLDGVALEGELILKRAVKSYPARGFTTVVLKPSLPISQQISAGSWVQIWRTSSSAEGFVGELLVMRSQVVTVTEDSKFISEPGSLVEVMVTPQQAALILQTLAADLEIYLLVTP